MLECSVPTCPGLCYLYSHMAHSLFLRVKCAKIILLYNRHDSDLNYVWLEYVAFTHHRLIGKNFGEKNYFRVLKNRCVNNSWWNFQIATPLTRDKRVTIIHKWKQTDNSCSNASLLNPQVSTCPFVPRSPLLRLYSQGVSSLLKTGQ